jgi:hypothetical protein
MEFVKAAVVVGFFVGPIIALLVSTVLEEAERRRTYVNNSH